MVPFDRGDDSYCAALFHEQQRNSVVAQRLHAKVPTSLPIVQVSLGSCSDGRDQLAHDPNGITGLGFIGGHVHRRLGGAAFPSSLLAVLLDYACGPATPAAFTEFVARGSEPLVNWLRGVTHAARLRAPRATPLPEGDLWTVKTRGDEARYVFLFASRAGSCNPHVALREVISDLDFEGTASFRHEREDPVPEPTPVPLDLLPIMQHVARIEFSEPTTSGGSMNYCSGLVLDADTVLTARHCVAPVEGASCLDDPRQCQSYSVDVGLLKNADSPLRAQVSLPVIEARAPVLGSEAAGLDFAFLTLASAPGVKLPRLPMQRRKAASTGTTAFLLAHPLGNAAMYSSCRLLDRSGGFEFHDCFACGGSSGAPLWTVEWSSAGDKPEFDVVGIHTRGMRNCLATGWADDVTPALKARLGEERGSCSGQASSIHGIFCEYCVRTKDLDVKLCEQLAGLLAGDERSCN